MFWIIGTLAFVAILLAGAYAVGTTLPREHVAKVRAQFAAKPEAVWSLLADVAGSQAWRKDLKSVEMLPDSQGKLAWSEETKFGRVRYVMDEFDPPHRMVRRIADNSLPFGGRWEIELVPNDAGCELSITEYGTIDPPLFRFMARHLFGYARTIMAFEKELGERLGERVVPEIVR